MKKQQPLAAFTEDEVHKLRDLIQWWDRRQAHTDITSSEVRPIFKRTKSVTRSIRLDQSLWKAAEKRARQDRAATGGSVNGLVEWLLWRHLDSDPVFVEPEDSET